MAKFLMEKINQDVTLKIKNATKSFAGVTVLNNVSFDLYRGEVHSLLGENGAGKSTLIKILSGVHKPDQGKVILENKEFVFNSPKEAFKNGIATVYQELLVFPELTVAENIFLGHTPKTKIGLIDWKKIKADSRKILDSLDSHDLDVNARVGSLSVANRQRVEIAKALSQKTKVLIMDEPTAALADTDVKKLITVVKRLREQGVSILYVSHKMPEIFELSDKVSVLRDGNHVGTFNIKDVSEDLLVSKMVGRPVDKLYPISKGKFGKPILEVNNFTDGLRFKQVSFKLKRGEILGIAGVVGSGRSELAQSIFGINPSKGGSIKIDEKEVSIKKPKDARNLGIAYIPEDRGTQGLVKEMKISHNVSMANLDREANGILIIFKKEMQNAINAINKLGIRARNALQLVRQLSGGNQQKVVVAKWLQTEPRILIMDEPTRGIDVGAKSEIHQLMRNLADEGLAILMISSELPEVLGMSDRVLVMNNGTITKEFSKEHATPENVGSIMTQKVKETA